MPEFNFNTFLQDKDNVVWRKLKTWQRGLGAINHLAWQGFVVKNGHVGGIPSYFAFISVDDDNGTIGVSLSINARFEPRFNASGRNTGQKIIDNFTIGRQEDVSDQAVMEVMRQRYGLNELDFRQTPMSSGTGVSGWRANRELTENILARKALYNSTDQLMALVMLRKIHYLKGPDRYEVCAMIVPMAQGIAANIDSIKHKPSTLDVKEAMADWNRTARQLRGIGFNDEIQIPDWATSANWDFDLGAPMEISRKVKEVFQQTIDSFSQGNVELSIGTDLDDDDPSDIFASSAPGFTKQSQANASVSQYYQGAIPDPSQLDQYVGTSSVEASQIRGIFGGVDEAIALVNQFDSSLLREVAFIYNFSGGGAYGVYMSALDEEIKNAKLKSMLINDGYQIQDMPNGAFYATHKDKDEQKIDQEIAAYRKQIDDRGATTFGIDMNKVIEAAKSDAAESGITDQNDQRMLGVLHLGATMVHEAVHSKGSQSEGPSEQIESKFMAWAMPVINQQRQKMYQGQNREDQYSPLVIDISRRRMAQSSNWLEKAAADGVTGQLKIHRQAQYGAQFLHNQTFVKNFGPAPWSSAFWSYGIGPIESMLDRVRPQPVQASKLSFEGQLRSQNQDKWMSSVDAGVIAEELLEEGRDSLVAYKSTEKLMEDSRTKPLMLPVSKLKRKASYDSGKDAWGHMCNLDTAMEERVEKWDYNDEENTNFDKKFIRNQSRYQPEYGNPMSKEDGIYKWIVDPATAITTWDDAINERPSLRTSPWQRAASGKPETPECVQTLINTLKMTMYAISNDKIKGTRFLCSDELAHVIKRFFENDLDVRVDVLSGDNFSKVWVVNDSVPTQSVELAEAFVCGDSDDDEARQIFNDITNIPAIRRKAIKIILKTMRKAMSEAGVDGIFVLGDLPLAIQTRQEWDAVRTVDFCSNDTETCLKLGDIVCDALGIQCEQSSESETMVAHWNCATFRFMGGNPDLAESLSGFDIDQSPLTCEVHGRLVTPLMLAFDIANAEVVDLSGEANPDVEAKVVRTFIPPEEAIKINPLIIVDAIFLASKFGFVIDSDLANAAAKAEFSNPDAQSVWTAIRVSGKGKSLATAEEYGMKDILSNLMGEKSCPCL